MGFGGLSRNHAALVSQLSGRKSRPSRVLTAGRGSFPPKSPRLWSLVRLLTHVPERYASAGMPDVCVPIDGFEQSLPRT
jgi:hypothetical protein